MIVSRSALTFGTGVKTQVFHYRAQPSLLLTFCGLLFISAVFDTLCVVVHTVSFLACWQDFTDILALDENSEVPAPLEFNSSTRSDQLESCTIRRLTVVPSCVCADERLAQSSTSSSAGSASSVLVAGGVASGVLVRRRSCLFHGLRHQCIFSCSQSYFDRREHLPLFWQAHSRNGSFAFLVIPQTFLTIVEERRSSIVSIVSWRGTADGLVSVVLQWLLCRTLRGGSKGNIGSAHTFELPCCPISSEHRNFMVVDSG